MTMDELIKYLIWVVFFILILVGLYGLFSKLGVI